MNRNERRIQESLWATAPIKWREYRKANQNITPEMLSLESTKGADSTATVVDTHKVRNKVGWLLLLKMHGSDRYVLQYSETGRFNNLTVVDNQ